MDLRYVTQCLWPSAPHPETPVAREREPSRAAEGLLDTHTNGLCQQRDDLLSVIDRRTTRWQRRSRDSPPGESPDPDGEGAPALEQAKVCFKRRQAQLRYSRNALVEAGASPSHGVFEALDLLDNLYTWVVGTMQEVRWAVLISEGLRDKAESPEGRSFTSSAEWARVPP